MSKKKSFFRKYWWIFVIISVIILIFLFIHRYSFIPRHFDLVIQTYTFNECLAKSSERMDPKAGTQYGCTGCVFKNGNFGDFGNYFNYCNKVDTWYYKWA